MSVGPGSIVAGFRFLAWLFPATPLDKVTTLSLDQLQEKYKRRDWWINIFGLSAFLLLAVAYYFLLDVGAERYYRDLSRSAYFIRPSAVEWGVLAAFLSLTSSTFFFFIVLRWVLGRQEYELYLAYASQKAHPPAPYDPTKVFQLFFWLIFFPLALVAVLRIDNYTAFTDKAMLDNPFLSLGKEVEYPFANVRGVFEVRGYHARFEDKVSPHQIIVFADGKRWESSRGSGGSKLDHQREILRYVAERSGRKIQNVNFAEEIPE